MVFVLLIFALSLFIDGATDCANSVTGAVSSGALTPTRAVVLSSFLSFCGCMIFCVFLPAVAKNSAVYSFPEELCAVGIISSLLAVALWSGAAFIFSVPTSEGHGLISAAAGAALSLGGSISYARFFYVFLWTAPSALFASLLSLLFLKAVKKEKSRVYKPFLVASASLSSFFHGAQDGQKFLALAVSSSFVQSIGDRWRLALLFSFFMGAGTLFGMRIIKRMGSEIGTESKRGAVACDLGSAVSLLVLTLLGIPASTTQIRMTSLAFCSRASREKTKISSLLLLAGVWIATFPVCFFLGYFISKVFLQILL